MKCFLISFLFIFSPSFSQDAIYQSLIVDEKFTQDANSCIRHSQTKVEINSDRNMVVEKKKVITVFNKFGNKDIDAYLHYDKNVSVRDLEAIVYDKMGKEIKKIKKKDFRDISAVSGGTLYSDSRVYVLDYTPLDYPYTVKFSYKIKNENTAFLPIWRPINNYNQSVMNNEFIVIDNAGLNLRHLEKNLDFHNDIKVTKQENKIVCEAKNIKALEHESYSPGLNTFSPNVLFALSKFSLEGVEGQAENWKEFGKWRFDKLVKGRDEVSEKTKTEILNLIQGINDPIEKMKLIYDYVQSKTRYISVQVGIGGWQPIDAETVDEVKYGDCKGLANYTKALMKIAGIDAKYTVLYAGSQKRNVEKDFASMQSNHVILNIPLEDRDIWLECTNQDIPFGFLGTFTDDRDVLVIDETGGTIKHTDVYKPKDNYQKIAGQLKITPDGHLNADFSITSTGTQFDNKYYLEKKSKKDILKYYKSKYSHLNNLNVNSYKFSKNPDQVEFTEQLDFSSKNYCKKFGNRLMILVNALNQSISIPDKIKNRKTPFVIERGFFDLDNIEIIIPQGMAIESKPSDVNFSSKFGDYTAEFYVNDKGVLVYKRSLLLKSGEFTKGDYQNFRDFFKKINNADQSKIILTNKT